MPAKINGVTSKAIHRRDEGHEMSNTIIATVMPRIAERDTDSGIAMVRIATTNQRTNLDARGSSNA